MALFRESGAQHYSGDGSIHTWSDAHPEAAQQCHCTPLNDVHEITQVTDLNAILRKLHRHHPRIGLLHYYELTAPRHDMHEESFCAFGHGDTPVRCCDCVRARETALPTAPAPYPSRAVLVLAASPWRSPPLSWPRRADRARGV